MTRPSPLRQDGVLDYLAQESLDKARDALAVYRRVGAQSGYLAGLARLLNGVYIVANVLITPNQTTVRHTLGRVPIAILWYEGQTLCQDWVARMPGSVWTSDRVVLHAQSTQDYRMILL